MITPKAPRLYVYKGGNFTIIHTSPECPEYLGEAVASMEDWNGKKHDYDNPRTAENAERLVRCWNTHDELIEALEVYAKVQDDGAPNIALRALNAAKAAP